MRSCNDNHFTVKIPSNTSRTLFLSPAPPIPIPRGLIKKKNSVTGAVKHTERRWRNVVSAEGRKYLNRCRRAVTREDPSALRPGATALTVYCSETISRLHSAFVLRERRGDFKDVPGRRNGIIKSTPNDGRRQWRAKWLCYLLQPDTLSNGRVYLKVIGPRRR